jgi:GNAT superfamily N-acetyltransferase
MSLTAQAEEWHDVKDEMIPFLHQHWEEMEINKDKIPLGFQFDVYDRLAANGVLVVVTLRKEGKVVGYFWGTLLPHIHHKTCLTLMMDLYWVHPSVRGKGLPGVKLLREVEAEAKRRGAQQMFFGSKLHKDSSRLFEFLKMDPVEVYYNKWIGD